MHSTRAVSDAFVSPRALEWTLRVGAAMCFVGHGAFGILRKPAWVPYFAVAGIDAPTASRLMPLVGALDVALGLSMLVRPLTLVSAWMVVWAVWTALLRPLAGEPGWETLERAGNYGVPAALLVLLVLPASTRAWAIARRVLTAAVALLLLGHGALGIAGKPQLVTHAAILVGPGAAPTVAVALGWVEVALAALVVARPRPGILVGVACWKAATEALFFLAGGRAPGWEFVERGGSYTAPIALAMVLVLLAADRVPRAHEPSAR